MNRITQIRDAAHFQEIVAENLKIRARCGERTKFCETAFNYGRKLLEDRGYVKQGMRSIWKHRDTGMTANILYELPMQNSGSGRLYHPWWFHFAPYPDVDQHLIVGFISIRDTATALQALIPGDSHDLTIDPLIRATWPPQI